MDYITAQFKTFTILLFTLLMLSLNCTVSRAAVVDSELGFELELPERWIKLDLESAQSIYAQALSLFEKKKISKAQLLEFRELFSAVGSSTSSVFMPVDIIGLLKKKKAYSVVWLSLVHKHLPQKEDQAAKWCQNNRSANDFSCESQTVNNKTVMQLKGNTRKSDSQSFVYVKTQSFYQLSHHVSLAFTVFGSGDYDPDALLFKQNINKSTRQVVEKIERIYKQSEQVKTAEQVELFIKNLHYVADLGDPQANMVIAGYLADSQKPQQAEIYYKKAVATPWELADAMYTLAMFYHSHPELVDADEADGNDLITQAAAKGYQPVLDLVEQLAAKGNARSQYLKYQLTKEKIWLIEAAKVLPEAMLNLAVQNHSEETGDIISHVRKVEELAASGKLTVHDLKRLTPLFPYLLRINTLINLHEQALSEHKEEYLRLMKSIFEKTLAPLSASQALSESEWSVIYYQAERFKNRNGDPLFDIVEKYKFEAAQK
ncbi:hypothetical protein [Psychromonas ossibalaenae]|uniref:hypothetical protein n=1 Tax=Psychromonas ossibalaenae TaxID=444922 RepID=UPI00035EF9F2|nr:hypothetical protein [Psychromonas ossibalaenae]